jgi:thymidylate kinase
MDSSRLEVNPTEKGLKVAVYNWLARLEGRLYEQIPPPDIVLRLKISIETAKKRNRERIKPNKEADAYVESRHRQNRDWYVFGTKCIYDIDTEQSLTETIRSAKEAVWKSL